MFILQFIVALGRLGIFLIVMSLLWFVCSIWLGIIQIDWISLPLFTMGMLLETLSLWLVFQRDPLLRKTAKFTGIPGTLIVLFVIVGARWPGALHLGQAASHVIDQKSGEQAQLIETPQEIPCLPPYFIGKDGQPRYWRAPSARPIRCFDRPGKVPDSRTEEILVPLRGDGVALLEDDKAQTEQKSRKAEELKALELARLQAELKLKEVEARLASQPVQATRNTRSYVQYGNPTTNIE